MGHENEVIENLKPYGTEVYALYRCPKCGAEWRFTVKEVNFVGRHICCCSRGLVFRPIIDIKVFLKHPEDKFNSIGPKSIDTPQSSGYFTDKLYEETTQALLGLGYKPKEAHRIATQYIGTGKYSQVDQILADLFNAQNNDV
jgi:hypothetical protein